MTLDATQHYLNDLKEEFNLVTEQADRLEMLVDLGKDLEELSQDRRTPDTKVPGCVSEVFVDFSIDTDNKVHFEASSQSHIVKGFVQILLKSLNGLQVSELEQAKELIEQFIDQTGLNVSLIASRANAFGNVLKKMMDVVKE